MKAKRKSTGTLPDLSRATAVDLQQEPVMLNGMRVVFDKRVAVYPIDLDLLGEEEESDLGSSNGVS